MTKQSGNLSEPILTPCDGEIYVITKVVPEGSCRKSTMKKKLDFRDIALHLDCLPLKVKTTLVQLFSCIRNPSKAPIWKMNALQAQQELEREEIIDEYWTTACYAVACVAMLTAIWAIILHWDNIFIKTAFIFPLLAAPYIVVQRRKINKAIWLKEEVLRLQSQLSLLREQHQVLEIQNDQLEFHLSGLKGAERDLKGIIHPQGQNMNDVLHIVRQNGQISRQIAQLEEAQKVQLLLKLLLKPTAVNKNLQVDENDMARAMQLLKSKSLRRENSAAAFYKPDSITGEYSFGLSSLEDVSEYEPFTFPRRLSLD